ncbi:MAG: helix-turn-helix domain-containing protein [Sulfitobacter sp.]
MGRDKKNEQRQEQWTKWIKAHRDLPAWKALSFPARETYFHLQVRCFAETAQKKLKVRNNNGSVFRSPRDLARDMGCSPKTAMAALADLQAKGWIVATEIGHAGVEGKGKTSQFRLTMMDMGSGPSRKVATKDPERWLEGHDCEVLIHKSYLPKPRKGRAKNFKN